MSLNKGAHQLAQQWIISLAISVVCCAVLFVVFASYIVQMNNTLALTSARMEVLQENQLHLIMEVDNLKKGAMPAVANTAMPAVSPVPTASPVPAVPPSVVPSPATEPAAPSPQTGAPAIETPTMAPPSATPPATNETNPAPASNPPAPVPSPPPATP